MAGPTAKDKEVPAKVITRFAAFLTVRSDQVEDTRRKLLPYMIEEMPNPADWAMMVKTEREPDFIPADVLWYKPTGEHFDVNTAKEVSPGMWQIRPAWVNQGINPRQQAGVWKPISIVEARIPRFDGAAPPPSPSNPVPDTDPDIAAIYQRIDTLAAAVQEMVVLGRSTNNNVGVLAQELIAIKDRVHLLEDTPVPIDLSDYVAEGDTNRVFGHGHHVRLELRRK